MKKEDNKKQKKEVKRLHCEISASNMNHLEMELANSEFRTKTALINDILNKRYQRVKVS